MISSVKKFMSKKKLKKYVVGFVQSRIKRCVKRINFDVMISSMKKFV